MRHTFLQSVALRRSYYHLQDKELVDDAFVVRLVDELLAVMPSPFNVQSARLVVLFAEQHREFWHIVTQCLERVAPKDRFESTRRKIEQSFRSGHGTVLFYEDRAALDAMRKAFPLYADNVDGWSMESSGMMQFALWTGLEEFGYGASLQHYNPIIDTEVAERWLIDPNWRLMAQMPFGAPLDTPAERKQTSLPHNRRKLFGAKEGIE